MAIKCSLEYRRLMSLFLFLMIVTCPICGQVTSKKILTPNDYERWSTMGMLQISNDGDWVSYLKHYDYGQDSLFLVSNESDAQFYYPGRQVLDFNEASTVALIRKGDTLQIQNLINGSVEQISNVKWYESTKNDEHLIINISNSSNNSESLLIKTLSSSRDYFVARVETFEINRETNSLLYTTKKNGSHFLYLMELSKKHWKPILLRKSTFPFKQLVWGPSGKSFAYLQKSMDSKNGFILHFYSKASNPHWNELNPFKDKVVDESTQLSDSRLFISKDDQKVFFKTVSKLGNEHEKKLDKDEIVEIWHSEDKIIYPRRQALGLDSPQKLTMVWWPETNRFMKLGSTRHPNVVITPNYTHAISYNTWENEPQYKFNPDFDFFITNLANGQKELLVEQLSYQGNYLSVSEDGKFIKYFKDKNWWLYNVNKKEHINLTKDLEGDWYYLSNDNKENVMAFGSPGSSLNPKSILVYDKYDLWQISVDGKIRKRLTRGRERGIKYRIDRWATLEDKVQLFPSFIGKTFDLGKGLILNAKGNNLSTGYFYWLPEKGLQKLVYGPKRIYNLRKAKKTNDYVYFEETYENPVQLVHLSLGSPRKILVSPNSFQKEYFMGNSELIGFKNKKGDSLKGVLIYPSNYVSGIKYPMIVNVYEQQHGRLFKAVVPTEFISVDHINPTIYSSKGYFVFYPDIKYSIGQPGKSALECVVAGVEKVIKMGLVDPDRIGIYGASFGGYETNYIISKTNIFATGVSGVSINDLVSRYLSINEKKGYNEALHSEFHQFRMGNSFVENFQNYIDNSPVHNADSIHTPLLAWVGKEDRHVHWNQSIELYLALRRLQKEHVLLVYPGEGHSIMEKEKQLDLSRRMMEWFDHYLKGYPKKKWMENANW